MPMTYEQITKRAAEIVKKQWDTWDDRMDEEVLVTAMCEAAGIDERAEYFALEARLAARAGRPFLATS